MLSTKRSVHQMLAPSPERLALLTDVNGDATSSGGFGMYEPLKRRRLVPSDRFKQAGGDENVNTHVASRKRCYNSFSCGNGANVPFTAMTKRIRAVTAADVARDSPKYSERQVIFLKQQHAQELEEANVQVQKAEALASENTILKRAVRWHNNKLQKCEQETEVLRREANALKAALSQIKAYVQKTEQEKYALQVRIQSMGAEPHQVQCMNDNGGGYGF
jgi:hypothetical protein